MIKRRIFDYILMTVNMVLIVLLAFVHNYYASFCLGAALLFFTVLSVVHFVFEIVNGRFYFQIIPVIACYLFFITDSFYLNTFGEPAFAVYIFIALLSISLAVFVWASRRICQKGKAATDALISLVLLFLLLVNSAFVLNVALSPSRPYTAECSLTELSGEYDGHHISSVPTKTFAVDGDVTLKEIEIRASLGAEVSDRALVEIRRGLFCNVYRVCGITKEGERADERS
ncbi:MAG: hypothetical protein IJ046_04950 [Clostridia bacterium]|nr:hypothetical protein [Clostridia bacterium]